MLGKHISVASAVVLAAGVGGAAAMLLAPAPDTGAEPTRLRELAGQTRAVPEAAPVTVTPENPPTATVTPAEAAVPVVVQPVRAEAPAPVTAAPRAAARPVSSPPVHSPAAQPAPPQDDAVKNIALTGVTSLGGQDQALLFDLGSNGREAVSVGGRAFGFTVRKIEPEAVVLARGSAEYTVRLGDKSVPTNEGAALASAEGDNERGAGGRFAGRNGFGARGGPGGDDAERARRRSEFFARFGGQNGRPSFATGNPSFGGEAATFSSDGDNSRGGREEGRRDGGSRSNWQPGFQPTFNPAFMMMGGWGSNRNNSQPSFGSASTTNPQTARRRGGQLVGGASTTNDPTPINNPQTQRRLGNTSGPAFGQDQTTPGNRSGFNRSGNNFGRGTSSR